MNKSMKSVASLAVSVLAAAVLSACAVAPDYRPPAPPAVDAFKEAQAQIQTERHKLPGQEGSAWIVARPSEASARGNWWEAFDDQALSSLIQQAMSSNFDLQAAAARLEQARALRGVARSEYFPTIGAGFGPSRSRPSQATDAGARPTTTWSAEIGVSYEVDISGRVRASVQAAKADAEQAEALYKTVELALQADVAISYFLLRQLDAEQRVIAAAVDLRQQAFELIQTRYQEGDIGEVDLMRAKTELATAQASASAAERARATAEHALAVLVGKPPANFDMPTQAFSIRNVEVPAGLPSTLLERRPDVAAAERAMAAANARIGVARSAYFPSLTLTGSGGYQSSSLRDLFNWSSRSFLLGPIAGTVLSLPIFDGGRRKNELTGAKARYSEEVAAYQQQILVAFKEVEDGLSNKRTLDEQIDFQTDAVDSSNRALALLEDRYQEGEVGFLDVIDAQRTTLQAERDLVALQGQRATNLVGLIKALGGGWQESGDEVATR